MNRRVAIQTILAAVAGAMASTANADEPKTYSFPLEVTLEP